MRKLMHISAVAAMIAFLSVEASAVHLDAGFTENISGDYQTVLKELGPPSEQGNADRYFKLGIRYLIGEGVPLDHAEAARWFTKAAEQGLASAQHNLGVMYMNGTGVLQDNVEAVKWYRKAAEQDHAPARYNPGLDVYERHWRSTGSCGGCEVVHEGC